MTRPCHDCRKPIPPRGRVRCDDCNARNNARNRPAISRKTGVATETPAERAPVGKPAYLVEQDRLHGFDYRRSLKPRSPEKAPPGPIEGVRGYVERLPSYARPVVIEQREMPSLVSF